MNFEAFITCAVTGSGDTAGKHPDLPVTPEQIAQAAVESARAGAAIAHIHVRDPETGAPSREKRLYAEVVDRVRDSGTDVVLNLTTGMGGDLFFGEGESPLPPARETDLAGPLERIEPVVELLPEICTLDCGSLNFGEGNYVVVNTSQMLRTAAARLREIGVRPEMEVFDTGHLVFVKRLIKEGLVEDPVMIQLCMGIPYGAPADPGTLLAMVSQLPPGAIWSTFSLGRMQLPYAAMAVLAGGNVRVGLEDNLMLERGVYASNAQLVERAVTILSAMNVSILQAADVRERLKLQKRW
jgi:uncharacterized protein (DUF849 family)